MSIYVIRHGQTDWNVKGLYQGHTDIKLNETGKEQAKQLNKLLKDIHFDFVFSSPLSRAQETAKICLKGRNIPIQIEDSLIERYFGETEGHSPFEFADCNNDLLLDFNLNYSKHNVEPIQNLFDRTKILLDKLCKDYKDKNILLVTHSAVSIAIEYYFNGLPKGQKLINLALENGKFRKYL